MSKILRIENIHKTYKSNNSTTVALNGISTEFDEGMITGLLGKNGAGKTTLIKCIVGLVQPESGEVYFRGENVKNNRLLAVNNISVLLDGGRNLYWNMSVDENIRYFSMLRGMSKTEAKIAYESITDSLEIDSIRNKLVGRLSFGMRQRASIAVALVANAQLIFLDEPTTGLDIGYQAELAQLLKKLNNEQKCTFVVSSHDMNFIQQVCDKCVLIHEGQILKSGNLMDFLSPFETSNYILKCRNALTETDMEKLSVLLQIKGYEAETHSLSVFWENGHDVYDLLNIMHVNNIEIVSLQRSDDLMAAVLSIMEEGVCHDAC